MDENPVPNSLALIPDGNRRWARKHRLSILSGYQLGVRKFIDFSDWCKEYGVRNLTVWGFSKENFQRSRNERSILFNIYRQAASDQELIEKLHRNKTRVNIVGDKKLFPKDLVKAFEKIEGQTKEYRDRVINMLIGYGGRDDIIYAAKEYAKRVLQVGRITALNDTMFKNYLLSCAVPDIDFVIRTSKEERVSGFLPWQIGYAELYFSNKLWPDFSKGDLKKALAEYSRRHRRFGR